MGGGFSKVKVSIGNAYQETVWATVTQDIVRTNCLVVDGQSSGNWYQKQRGYQRIGPGGYVTFNMNLPRNTPLVYVSVGTDSGMQISDCLPKDAVNSNLIVTQEGCVMDAKLTSRWEDEDGKCHRPAMRNEFLQSFAKQNNDPKNFNINLVQSLKGSGTPDPTTRRTEAPSWEDTSSN